MDTAPVDHEGIHWQNESTERLVLTIAAGPAAAKVRALARHFKTRPPEIVRRGLSLLQLYATLQEEPGAYLAVRRPNGEIERVVLLDT